MAEGTLTLNFNTPDIDLTGSGSFDISETLKSLFFNNPSIQEEITSKIRSIFSSIDEQSVSKNWSDKLSKALNIKQLELDISEQANLSMTETFKKLNISMPEVSANKESGVNDKAVPSIVKSAITPMTSKQDIANKHLAVIEKYLGEQGKTLKDIDVQTDKPDTVFADKSDKGDVKSVKSEVDTVASSSGGNISNKLGWMGKIGGIIGVGLLAYLNRDKIKKWWNESDAAAVIRSSLSNVWDGLKKIWDEFISPGLTEFKNTIVNWFTSTEWGSFVTTFIKEVRENFTKFIVEPLQTTGVYLGELSVKVEAWTQSVKDWINNQNNIDRVKNTAETGAIAGSGTLSKILSNKTEKIFSIVIEKLEKSISTMAVNTTGGFISGMAKFTGKTVLKSLLTKLPLIGPIIMLGQAFHEFSNNETEQGLLSLLNAVIVNIPYAGIPLSIMVDVIKMKKAADPEAKEKGKHFNAGWEGVLKTLKNVPIISSLIYMSEGLGHLFAGDWKNALKKLGYIIPGIVGLGGLTEYTVENFDPNIVKGMIDDIKKKIVENLTAGLFTIHNGKFMLSKTAKDLAGNNEGDADAKKLSDDTNKQYADKVDQMSKDGYYKDKEGSAKLDAYFKAKSGDKNTEAKQISTEIREDYEKYLSTKKDKNINENKNNPITIVQPDKKDKVLPVNDAIIAKEDGFINTTFKEISKGIDTLNKNYIILLNEVKEHTKLFNVMIKDDERVISILPTIGGGGGGSSQSTPKDTSNNRDPIYDYRKRFYDNSERGR